jgi:hypothetical protein
MKELRIPLHSVVDVITNSSTVIYTQASSGAAKIARAMIEEILEIAGCDKKVEDLFDISVKPAFNDMWEAEEALEEMGLKADYSICGGPGRPSHSEVREKFIAEHQARLDEILERKESDFRDYWDGGVTIVNQLVIKTKEGANIKLAANALALFDQEACYDG